jgi:hypothetical protein
MTFKLIICQEPIKPLQAKHRFFGNLGYETPVLDKGKQWKFDYTLNWLGNSNCPLLQPIQK